MKRIVILLSVAAAVVPFVGPAPVYAQLYGDGKDAVKGGLNDQDYWWAKFDDMMLDMAVKQHQPEGRIGFELATMERRLDELVKKYPKHEDIKKMKQHADDVLKRTNPNADRGAPFGPECPWEEANFAQLWVNMHWAKMSWDAKDYQNVRALMQNVNQNLDIMLVPGRMKSYPAELSGYVLDAKPEAETLTKMVNEKLNPAAGGDVQADPAVTKGDLNNQDYWWAKYDEMMLEYALKNHEPEGHIDVQLDIASRRMDELLKKYPNHEGLRAIKLRMADIKSKIDPKAPRSAAFTPDTPWEEANFAQLWVNLHHAQLAHQQGDNGTAAGLLSNIKQNQEIMLKPGRMKDYPPELKKWVDESQVEYEKLAKELKGKR